MGIVSTSESHLFWRLVCRNPDVHLRIEGFKTPIPVLSLDGLAPEIAVLLPNQDAQATSLALLETIGGSEVGEVGIGLFLANPFLRVDAVGRAMSAAGVRWVTNLPSVEQQDREFSQQLEDVGLDRRGEGRRLRAFKDLGFRTAAVVSDGEGAGQMLESDPDAIIVLPRIGDFAAGFPSLRQRGAALQDVRAALSGTSWDGPLLGLADETEADHVALWPDILDGVIVRPRIVDA